MSLYRKTYQILALITVFSFVSCSENENMEVKIVNEPSEGDVLSREAKRGKQELEDGSLYEGEMVAAVTGTNPPRCALIACIPFGQIVTQS